MKKQRLNLSSMKLIKLSLFQLRKIKGKGGEGDPDYEDLEGKQGNP